jgi:hypothetical protein
MVTPGGKCKLQAFFAAEDEVDTTFESVVGRSDYKILQGRPL